MRKVKFIEDFANKVIGNIINVDSMLASHLVNIDKVAEYITDEEVEVKSKKK